MTTTDLEIGARNTVCKTLPEFLVERASDPERVWLENVDGTTATYAQAVETSLRWADAFRRIGVEPGEVVASMQLNTFDFLFGWLGLAWLRAIAAPFNTDYRGELLRHVLTNTRARVLVIRQEYVSRVLDLGDLDHLEKLIVVDPSGEPLPANIPYDVVQLDDFLDGAVAGPVLEFPAAWDPSCVMYTSGTTGPSKGVIIPWGQLHQWTMLWDLEGDFTSDEVIHCPGPTFHMGAVMFPYLAALVGGRAFVRPYIHIASTAEDLRRCTFATWVFPQAMHELLAQPPSPDDKNFSLRTIPAGPVFPGLVEFCERFGVRTFRIFNMTEAGCPINDPSFDNSHFAADGTASVGKLRQGYPWYEVRLVDEHDQEVPPGVPGELIVRSAVPWTMNAGYLNMPEATAHAWRNGWYHTGDALVRDEDGNYFFQDRIKDAIRRRNENISSFEVELSVMQHPAVQAVAAVAAREPGVMDEEVKICVVLKPEEKLSPEELIEFLIPRMPRFMVPRYVEFLDDLPRTPTNKVRKFELRERGITDQTWDREAAGIVVPR